MKSLLPILVVILAVVCVFLAVYAQSEHRKAVEYGAKLEALGAKEISPLAFLVRQQPDSRQYQLQWTPQAFADPCFPQRVKETLEGMRP